jgi:hypothetical protein
MNTSIKRRLEALEAATPKPDETVIIHTGVPRAVPAPDAPDDSSVVVRVSASARPRLRG